ncbi:Transposase IS200 like protein [compost metagenome]
MYMVLGLLGFIALGTVWGLVIVNWDAVNPWFPVAGASLTAYVLYHAVAISRLGPIPHPETVEAGQVGIPDAPATDWDRSYTTEDGTEVFEMGDEAPARMPDELADAMVKLRLELREARAVADAFGGPAVARIRGRAHEWRGHGLALAVQDGDGYQRVSVRVPDEEDRQAIRIGDRVDLACTWVGGRLAVERVIAAVHCDDPMPLLPEPVTKGGIPDWFDSQDTRKRDLLKASDGSSSVSELRVHLVWCTKRRGKVLTAPMVERLKTLTAEVVEVKGLGRLLAVNAEEDHVHVALHLPANLSSSEAVGLIKAFTARMLRREFPELKAHHDESLWQRGFYAGAIGNGGDLSTVLAYIANQDAPQDDQEGAPKSDEGEETGAA